MAKWIFVLCLLLQEALSSMFCVKYFGGWHGKEYYPYVSYGHELKKGEKFRQGLRSNKQTPSCVPTYGNALRYLRAMANKAKAGCFARLSKGKVLRGLLRRRKVEFALFLCSLIFKVWSL